jgi:hypothetical protein
MGIGFIYARARARNGARVGLALLPRWALGVEVWSGEEEI